jgi:hypothetical protein
MRTPFPLEAFSPATPEETANRSNKVSRFRSTGRYGSNPHRSFATERTMRIKTTQRAVGRFPTH